jgi:transposase InsO family protein
LRTSLTSEFGRAGSTWLYLAFVLDTYSRKVLGWSMTNNLRTKLVLDALNMAIYNRRPQPGLIHHSDRGSQYTSVEFGSRLKEAGLFVSTLKRELIHRHSWPSPQMVRTAFLQNTSKASTTLDVGTPRWGI